MLDLPPPSAKASSPAASQAAEEDAPAAKRPKFGSGGGGLAGLLPAPKNTGALRKPAPVRAPISTNPVNGDDVEDPERIAMRRNLLADPNTTSSSLLLPPSVVAHKGKGKAVAEPPSAADFFSLGAVGLEEASTRIPSASSSSAPRPSAAPTVREVARPNHYATLPSPSPAQPYPGFHCLPSGQWVPDQPDDWAAWSALHGWDQTSSRDATAAVVPKGFNQDHMQGAVDVRGGGGGVADQGAPAARPSKIVLEEEDESKPKQVRPAVQRTHLLFVPVLEDAYLAGGHLLGAKDWSQSAWSGINCRLCWLMPGTIGKSWKNALPWRNPIANLADLNMVCLVSSLIMQVAVREPLIDCQSRSGF